MTAHVRLIVILVGILLTPTLAFGQSDTTPPTLVSFTFSPTTIDTTAAPQTITVTMRITDDLAGVRLVPSMAFRSPSGGQVQNLNEAFSLMSGTPVDGVWQGILNFPQFTESGTWTVSFLALHDSLFNSVTHNAATLQALGFNVNLNVTSVPDTAPPQLVGLRLIPSAVDVSAGQKGVTLELDLIDAPAGAQFPPLDLSAESVLVSPSGRQFREFNSGSFQLIAGTAQNGTWQAIIARPLPQFSEAGTWALHVNVRDTVSNRFRASPSELRALGFSPDLVVTSVPSDTTPPQLVDFSFTPILIDTSTGDRPVQVTFTATDNLAGVSFPINGFRSASGTQGVSPTDLALISGTPQNGTWQGTALFRRFAEAGTWTVNFVQITDAVGNFSTPLDTAALQAAGFPTQLTVVQPSLVVDDTVDPAAGGTVMDQTFGTRAQVTFPSGVLGASTDVAIDVFDSPLSIPTPSGFTGPGTHFVNIALTPAPAFPLPAPGLTVVLPLTNIMIPGATIDLFRVDPATGNLVPALDVAGQPVVGTVDSSGLSATFTEVASLSIVVGLVPVRLPFSALTAKLRIKREGDEFSATGMFTLGANSDGIDPRSEVVRFQLGPYATSIPVGLFTQKGRHGPFVFEGLIDGVELAMTIHLQGQGRFGFQVAGEGANLNGVGNPLTLVLAIGNDGGSEDVVVKHMR